MTKKKAVPRRRNEELELEVRQLRSENHQQLERMQALVIAREQAEKRIGVMAQSLAGAEGEIRAFKSVMYFLGDKLGVTQRELSEQIDRLLSREKKSA